ncbi:divalent metal cation transporter [Candidatus Saccharibacteria bacterium]|nr:MAG: divalent metal cation transporter [Candidatus Saccharibacteria bacterium]
MTNPYTWLHDLVGDHQQHARAAQHEKNLQHAQKHYGKFGRFIRVLGPGVVTGAADDDPSGIATYSQAGAVFGYGLLWLFPIMYPLLLAVQESCARIGAVTGDGLAAILKRHYSRKVLLIAVLLVVVANTVNIGADLAAMAATTQLLLPSIPLGFFAIFFAIVCVIMQVTVPYKQYAKILKWLAIALFAYPVTAFLVGQPWGEVLTRTVWPQVTIDKETIYIMVGILGTTISPYLFFWNTSEVVEGEVETHRIATSSGKGVPRISKAFIRSIRIDNVVGMSLASISAWFIVIACASVLHANGITKIDTAADAAAALEPLVQGFPNAGLVAKLLFSVGIIGIGLLAVPVLAGSSSYAISEALGLREGYYRKFSKAHGFYGIIALATVAGLIINFIGIDPIQALIFTAVFNAVASVPLLYMIWRVGNNRDVMGEYKNGKWSNIGVVTAFLLMAAASFVLFYSTLPR